MGLGASCPKMVDLSPDDVRIIGECPLGPCERLDTQLRSLRESEDIEPVGQDATSKVEQTADPAIQHSGQESLTVALEDERKETVIEMLRYLLASYACSELSSKTQPDEIVSTELSQLLKCIRRGDFAYGHYHPLLELFNPRQTDTGIWRTVFALIQIVYRRTTPSSTPPSFEATPVKCSSVSQQGNEQTASLLRSLEYSMESWRARTDLLRDSLRNISRRSRGVRTVRTYARKSKAIQTSLS